MPEGSELKLSAELIRPLMVNQIITDAYPSSNSRYAELSPEGYLEFKQDLSSNQCQVLDIQTKGKFMYWTFTTGYLFCTFGMTGQFSPTRGKHPCFIFQYGDKEMVFNDPRHFGTIKFTKSKQELTDKLNNLGWDPLANTLEKYDSFIRDTLKKSNKCIGQLLLDQGIFCGVGNYVRAESLYAAKLSPWRATSSLTKEEVTTLQNAIINVMTASYQHQGATIHSYQTPFGDEGKYSNSFKVYGLKNDSNGFKIKREKMKDGRAIYWCPDLQK